MVKENVQYSSYFKLKKERVYIFAMKYTVLSTSTYS